MRPSKHLTGTYSKDYISIEVRFDSIEERLGRMETKLDKMLEILDEHAMAIRSLLEDLPFTNRRIDRIEKHVGLRA